VERAVAALGRAHGPARVRGVRCDVTRADDVEALWAAAADAFGGVDVWVNNAGACNPTKGYADLAAAEIIGTVDANVRGTMLGAWAAVRGMRRQGGGQLFNMEGWGSRGEWSPGMTVYSATKRAVAHFTRGLVRETRGTGVLVGTLGPGIVATDLLVDAWTGGPPEHWRRVRGLFRWVIDPPEPVCAWLADRVLANTKTGVHFRWATPLRIGARFLQPRYWRRNPLAGTALDTFGVEGAGVGRGA
jgi:NAD(P)-dependent dehydrogenase (short-subunit alcohol dehydrogenase family)